ncbi:MAG: hypothetical protein PVJ67_04105 [Candidatus Pacearchaeota archaeon]
MTTKNNKEIVIEELKKELPLCDERDRHYRDIHIEYIATNLLSKLNKLDRENVEKIIEQEMVKHYFGAISLPIEEWIEITDTHPKDLMLNITNQIISLIPEEGEVITEQKECQIVCQLHIETEYRKYDYEVENGEIIDFVSLSGKKIRIIPKIKFKEFKTKT